MVVLARRESFAGCPSRGLHKHDQTTAVAELDRRFASTVISPIGFVGQPELFGPLAHMRREAASRTQNERTPAGSKHPG